MTAADYIQHVDNSIGDALDGVSAVAGDVLKIKGFSTSFQRRLMSNLCHFPKENRAFLECGLLYGASLCAAMSNNPALTAIGIEDFSQSFGDDNVRQQLADNLYKFRRDAKSCEVIDSDCFKVDVSKLPKVDVFSYDACHDYAPQFKALPYFLEAMADVFCFICDDFQWQDTVRLGTLQGIQSLSNKIKVEKHWDLVGKQKQDCPIFHNGIGIWIISRL